MLLGVAVLILAVLLFGSSAVLGFFGMILGFIATAAGLAILMSVVGEPSAGQLLVAGFSIILVIGVIVTIFDRHK